MKRAAALWALPVVAWLVVLGLAAAATQSAPSNDPADEALVLVDKSRSSSFARISASGARVLCEFDGAWLAAGDARALAHLRETGLEFTILDASLSGGVFYTAWAPEIAFWDSSRPGIRVLARRGVAAVLKASPPQAEALAAQGVELARVFLTPMREPRVIRPEALSPQQPVFDARIETMVSMVSIANVNADVQRLQDFVTRYSGHDSCRAAGEWIRAKFESCGIDSTRLQTWNSGYSPNVIALIPGQGHPEKMVVIGGHYDSITANYDFAPGADDNASGTACVLECARILSQYDFDYTLVFIAFSGEEQGLLGSEAYAAEAAARGDDIVGMVAVDMIGYVAPDDSLDLDLIDNTASAWMRERIFEVASLYVPGFTVVHGSLATGSSDHASFWRHGYDAIMFFEDSGQYSPYIHRATDVVGTSYISPALAQGSVRTAVAFAADLAQPLPLPTSIHEFPPTAELRLEQNFPNPFNPETTIRFEIPAPGEFVSLGVFDVAGRSVSRLIRSERVAGFRAVRWNGRDDNGRQVPSGVYFYRLQAGEKTVSRKMIVLR